MGKFIKIVTQCILDKLALNTYFKRKEKEESYFWLHSKEPSEYDYFWPAVRLGTHPLKDVTPALGLSLCPCSSFANPL